MPAITTITGKDTLTLNGRVFADFATDDTSVLQMPNKLVDIKTGKNGNTVFALNNTGYNGKLALKLMRGSPDDQFMLGLLNTMTGNFPATVLINGNFVKNMGDGTGTTLNDSYTLSAGLIDQIPDAKDNASGETDQATTTYNIMFAQISRGIL